MRDRGKWNERQRYVSLDITVRAVAIVSGEMDPESGMLQSSSMTRPLADKSSFGIDGSGILLKLSFCKRGAEPPKNESRKTGTTSPSTQTCRCVSSGNGFCIAATNLSQRKLLIPSI